MANKKNINKRKESTKKYTDAILDEHSKICVVRVDFAYKKPHNNNITLEDANKDLDHMFNNMRSKPSVFKDKVGYICKREYTEDKGVYFHTIFIYDGQKVQKDAFKGDQIGQYWEQITQEKGSYYNCNRNKYAHNGIGIINHKDSEKRKILNENVIAYLCKDEQDIAPIKKNKKDRAFTRGTLPKSKGKIGRPRV